MDWSTLKSWWDKFLCRILGHKLRVYMTWHHETMDTTYLECERCDYETKI